MDEIKAQFTLIISWFDKRLLFNNLNSKTEKNSHTNKERKELWVPKVVFANTKEKIQTVMDDITTANVKSFNTTAAGGLDKLIQ